jgi:mutator protein MutT
VNTDRPVTQGVVVVVRRERRLLVVRRAPGIVAGGAWCFVGGAIEAGESQAQAVVREFREEVGGHARPVRKIWDYTRPDGALRLHWWLADLLDDHLQAAPAEVAELRWCTPEEIQALPGVLAGNLEFLQAVGRGLVEGGVEEAG